MEDAERQFDRSFNVLIFRQLEIDLDRCLTVVGVGALGPRDRSGRVRRMSKSKGNF